jgi:FkbM family methyltransferase
MAALRAGGYASQFGQDVVVDALFRGLDVDRGVYVDVGANDGETGSNTLVFERVRGWDGICIEPLPSAFGRLAECRRATVLNCAIGEHTGEADFRAVEGYAEMLSGLETELDPRHRARIAEEVARYGGTQARVPVPVRRLDDVLEEHGVRQIDYLSVDVEGAELSVIRSMSFERVEVLVLTIENNYDDHEVARYLEERSGLRRVLRIGADDVYVDLALVRAALSR